MRCAPLALAIVQLGAWSCAAPASESTAPPVAPASERPRPVETLTADGDEPDPEDDFDEPPPPEQEGEQLLYDFSPKRALHGSGLWGDELDKLLQRFPHPHAPPGKHCDPNYPGSPGQKLGGTLLPTVTQVEGSFTSPGATQVAIFIDYCPTGAGVPRTMRLLVLEGDTVALDHEFDEAAPPDTILHAVDVDGDGHDEVLLTRSDYVTDRIVSHAQLVRLAPGPLETLERWPALRNCTLDDDTQVASRIFYRRRYNRVTFRAQVVKDQCLALPAP